MSEPTLDAWGWRIPFLLGLVVGIAGYLLRRHVLETVPAERRKRAPIIETLHDHWRIVLGFAGLSVFNAVSFYVGFVYLVSWLQTADGMAPARALEINSVSMAVLLPVMIATGFLTDRIGRKPGLVDRTGEEIAPAFLIMAAAMVTFVTLLWLRETYRSPFIGGSSGAAALYARI